MSFRIHKDHWTYRIPIAHRGLHDAVKPENSLAAFTAAVEAGYAIEFDLHLLSDGHFAVFHDDHLQRMTGQNGNVQELTTSQLSSYFLKGTSETIPEFRQMLDCVAGRVPLLIEMKLTENNLLAAQALNTVMKDYEQQYGGEFVVESFDPRFLMTLKQVAPQFLRGQLATQNSGHPEPEENRRLATCAYNYLTEPDFIAYHIADLPLDWLSKLREEGMPVLGWTARNQEQWDRATAHCDNLIFENLKPEIR